VSNLLVFAGLFGRSGGVANLKTVPIYQGVTDVFLRPSCTGPDVADVTSLPMELYSLGIHRICVKTGLELLDMVICKLT
jgi:hypothetical protein